MNKKFGQTHGFVATLVAVSVFYVACGEGMDSPPPPLCVSVSDCDVGHRCINNQCIPPGVDAGELGFDAAAYDAASYDAAAFFVDAGEAEDAGRPDSEDAAIDAPMSGSPP